VSLQTKRPEELQQLVEAVTDRVEAAASTADLRSARRALLHSMERLRDDLAAPRDGLSDGRTGTVRRGAVKRPAFQSYKSFFIQT